MRTRLVTTQLRLFVVITTAALAIMGIFYVKIPGQLGVGRFDMTVELENSAGLYPKSLVTYRGVEVGQVRRLELRTEGVRAHIEIDDGADIAADAVAYVRSASVIGEQYIDFVPRNGTVGDVLEEGDVVPVSATALPTTTDDLLNSLDSFLDSVPQKELRTVVRELGLATEGVGDDLGRMIEDGEALVGEASTNLEATTTLVGDLDRVLATQQELDPNIRRYAASLRGITGQIESRDADLGSLLATGPGFLSEVDGLVTGLKTELPGMLWETAATAEVAGVYRDNIEHLLILLPPAVATFSGAVPPERMKLDYAETNLYFKMSFPTACTNGFPEKTNMRDPSDVSLGPLPIDSYCRAPENSPLVVRGARNSPCPNSTDRAATAAACGLVFNSEELERSRALGVGRTETLDPKMADLLAPNGPLFLLDETAVPGPSTWLELLMTLVEQ